MTRRSKVIPTVHPSTPGRPGKVIPVAHALAPKGGTKRPAFGNPATQPVPRPMQGPDRPAERTGSNGWRAGQIGTPAGRHAGAKFGVEVQVQHQSPTLGRKGKTIPTTRAGAPRRKVISGG